MNRLIKRILGRSKKQLSTLKRNEIKTAPLAELPDLNGNLFSPNVEPKQFLSASSQSTGKQRDHNEDSLFTFSITLGNSTLNQPIGIFIVADGMGGHHHGEVASDIAIRTVAGFIIKKLHPVISSSHSTIDEPIQDILQEAVQEAQKAIHKSSPGSGTTLTAVLCLGQQMTIAHIGDSRAYTLFPGGRITSITRDHSLARRLEELGQFPIDSKDHPQRNILYRSLGIGDELEPDIFTAPFPQPGYLMLCSDGLWGVIPDNEVYRIVFNAPTIQSACQQLVDAANSAGGPDNISVVLVQLI